MSQAVKSDLAYVKSCCPRGVYKSVWDRLCEQLFGAIPIGMNAEENLPNIDIWRNSVSLLSDTEPYSFTIVSEDTDTPKPGDIIEYKGRYFIIGEVA